MDWGGGDRNRLMGVRDQDVNRGMPAADYSTVSCTPAQPCRVECCAMMEMFTLPNTAGTTTATCAVKSVKYA